MTINLSKVPKNPTIIEGFPGFGLIGTITTEFLIDHLKTEHIGTVLLDDLPAMVAIHNEKLVQPIGIHYNKSYNIIIFHVVTAAQGLEWKIADALLEIAEKVKAKQIVSIEGIGSSAQTDDPKLYYFTHKKEHAEKLKTLGLLPLKEGIIMGVTSSLLLKSPIPMSCVFSETHSNMPDSKAAAKVIELLDKYLDLKVDPAPLLATAEKFEGQIKDLLSQGAQAMSEADRKKMSYVG